MSASLILPTWSMRDSLNEVRNINITPYGANYVTQSTSSVQYIFVTGLNSGGMLLVGTFLIMTLLTIYFLALEYIYLKGNDDSNKYNRPNNYLYFSGILSLTTPLTFAILLPVVLNVNGNSFTFWGGFNENEIGNYGPNIGWFLQIIAFLIVMAAVINERAIRKEEKAGVFQADHGDLNKQSHIKCVNPQNNTELNESQIMNQPRLFCGNCGKVIPFDSNLCPYCASIVVINRRNFYKQ
jgi:hypothetical protein